MMKKSIAMLFLFLGIAYIYAIESSTFKASATRARGMIASDDAMLANQQALSDQNAIPNQIKNYTNGQGAAYNDANNWPLLGADNASKGPRMWANSTVSIDSQGDVTLSGPVFDNLTDSQKNQLNAFIAQNCIPANSSSLGMQNDPLKVLTVNGQTVYGCVREGAYNVAKGIVGQSNSIWSRSAIMVDAQGDIAVSGAVLNNLSSDQAVSFQAMLAQQCAPTNMLSLPDVLKQNPYALKAGNAQQVTGCVKSVYAMITNNQ